MSTSFALTTEGGKVNKTDKDSASSSLYPSGVTHGNQEHGTDSISECDEGSTRALKAKMKSLDFGHNVEQAIGIS